MQPQGEAEPTPAAEVYDDQGVDRSQIRQCLALTPRQRLDRAAQIAAFYVRVRERNARTWTQLVLDTGE